MIAQILPRRALISDRHSPGMLISTTNISASGRRCGPACARGGMARLLHTCKSNFFVSKWPSFELRQAQCAFICSITFATANIKATRSPVTPTVTGRRRQRGYFRDQDHNYRSNLKTKQHEHFVENRFYDGIISGDVLDVPDTF
jgi:hypothetical protein